MGRYLVTGITGFAGPHLANILVQHGHKVFGLVRGTNGMQSDVLDIIPKERYDEITFLYGDLLDRDSINEIFRKTKFDGVFHLAAQSHPPASFIDPTGTFMTNIIGTSHIIEAIRRYNPDVKLMFCSTSEVYGDTGKTIGDFTEGDRILPANPYGVSKASIDLHIQEMMKNNRLNAFITRAFSHTGPRRGHNFSVSSDAYQIAGMMVREKDDDKLNLYVGNLETKRVVMDVRDCVMAYYLLMINDKSSGEIFNVCGDKSTLHKMEYYTDILIELSGLSINKIIEPEFWRPIDIQTQSASAEKLKILTSWEQKYPIKTTLNDLLIYWIDKIKMVRSK